VDAGVELCVERAIETWMKVCVCVCVSACACVCACACACVCEGLLVCVSSLVSIMLLRHGARYVCVCE